MDLYFFLDCDHMWRSAGFAAASPEPAEVATGYVGWRCVTIKTLHFNSFRLFGNTNTKVAAKSIVRCVTPYS